ncbi:DnaJ-like protein [Clostridium perfringens]|uniref:DnaJ-like protein n=1 Tax=Clostridium perfringens TaxID=1502 RepID=A0A2X3IGK1_CLOPF|nr:DnaJ domain-containing protein [Clostridium perfringens]SQC85347.1 DnaJ-like protein [Clostridium perfringens]
MGFIVFCLIAYFVISNLSNKKDISGNKANSNCPYCNAAFYLTENGDFNCSNCGRLFKYRDGIVYRQDERLPIVVELACTLFTILCKADGIVTKDEVSITKELLEKNFGLEDKDMKMAIDILNKSKSKPYNKTIINDLNNIFNNYDFSKIDAEDYKELILRCAMIIAFCDDGEPSNNQNKILDDIVSIFNISATKYTNLLNYFRDNCIEKNKNDYYEILGVSEGASKEEIRVAFRKLSKLYHPDRYSSKDLPPEIIKEFEEKLAKIIEAYEALK